MSRSLFGIPAGLLILGTFFYLLERRWPALAGKPWWRREGKIDFIYWVFTPLVSKTLTRLSVLVTLALVVWLLGWKLDASLARGFGPVARQPAWAVGLEMLVLADFLGYWIHRLFHGGRLWKFHAIHHSSTELDWLSSVRLHPVNEMVARALEAVPLLLLGFPLRGLAVLVPFLTLHALLLHANLPWSFGPLRYWIASPVFHRWHHTCEEEALDRNFAGFFPVWDRIFGTFYMPKERMPVRFGLRRTRVPDSFLGQMVYPFR